MLPIVMHALYIMGSSFLCHFPQPCFLDFGVCFPALLDSVGGRMTMVAFSLSFPFMLSSCLINFYLLLWSYGAEEADIGSS